MEEEAGAERPGKGGHWLGTMLERWVGSCPGGGVRRKQEGQVSQVAGRRLWVFSRKLKVGDIDQVTCSEPGRTEPVLGSH